MRVRDNTLRANSLEHQGQFHRTLGRTRSADFEQAASTEAVKSRQISLLFVFSLQTPPVPKDELLHSGLPTDPNPARISATTKRLLPPKHDQDKQVQKSRREDFVVVVFKSKSADLTETPLPADLQNKTVLFLQAATSSSRAHFLSE